MKTRIFLLTIVTWCLYYFPIHQVSGQFSEKISNPSQTRVLKQSRISQNPCININGFGELQLTYFEGKIYLTDLVEVTLCSSDSLLFGFTALDNVALTVGDSCIMFQKIGYFYNPENGIYDYQTCYEIDVICINHSGEILVDTKYLPLNIRLPEQTIVSFVSTLDSIFDNSQLLLDKANKSGFSDMLFYCAMEGNEKAVFYFENLLEILTARDLTSQYGGEPAQTYHLLKDIYDNSKHKE
ncbi:MAG: hypothetical protein R3C61_28485 [Bacteroidia bacterium]